MKDNLLPFHGTETDPRSFFVVAITNSRHSSPIMVCFVSSFFSSVLLRDTTGAVGPGLLLTASKKIDYELRRV